MKHCLSVRSDLDTEEGRLLFANDIVERLFTRVWKDDKIMRRKRYFEEQPEAKRKGKLAQEALNHKAQNRKWHPNAFVHYEKGYWYFSRNLRRKSCLES